MVTVVVFTTHVKVTSSPGHIPLDGPVNWLSVPEIVPNYTKWQSSQRACTNTLPKNKAKTQNPDNQSEIFVL